MLTTDQPILQGLPGYGSRDKVATGEIARPTFVQTPAHSTKFHLKSDPATIEPTSNPGIAIQPEAGGNTWPPRSPARSMDRLPNGKPTMHV
jgi:hypothetical protein